MGLFSKKKEENNSGIPESLPDTLIDKAKLSSDAHSFKKEEDKKKISEEILSKENNAQPRQSNEIRYVQSQNSNQISSQGSGHRVPHMAPHEKLIKEKEENSKQIISKTNETQKPQKNTNSFFNHIQKYISKKDSGTITSFKANELVKKMKEHHESLRSGHDFFLHEKDVDEKVQKRMEELRELETEWLVRKRQLEAAELDLVNVESKMEHRFEEFKNILSTASMYRLFNTKAPDGKEFILNNGETIHTIQEMVYRLQDLDEETFHHHVNNERNDFASWIKYVFGAEELSKAIISVNDKKSMISALKDFSKN